MMNFLENVLRLIGNEKTFSNTTVEGLKELYFNKDRQVHEKLIKADSDVDYILINSI